MVHVPNPPKTCEPPLCLSPWTGSSRQSLARPRSALPPLSLSQASGRFRELIMQDAICHHLRLLSACDFAFSATISRASGRQDGHDGDALPAAIRPIGRHKATQFPQASLHTKCCLRGKLKTRNVVHSQNPLGGFWSGFSTIPPTLIHRVDSETSNKPPSPEKKSTGSLTHVKKKHHVLPVGPGFSGPPANPHLRRARNKRKGPQLLS
jgi:hypothetical protein